MLAAAKRLTKPFVVEAKRQLCFRGLTVARFETSLFGRQLFRCGNRTEYHRTVGFGGEAEVLGAFLFLLRADDVVWDVGASVGLFTVHAAAVAARVVAFEPDPPTQRRLKENVALNGRTSTVDCRAVALGSAPGRVALSSDGLDGNAPSLVDLGRHAGTVEIVVETVDALVAQGVAPPTVMKLDIEGAEDQALSGARELLHSERRPRVVFVEVHPAFLPRFGAQRGAVEDRLRAAGYQVLGLRPRGEQYHIVALSDQAWAR